MRKLTVRSSPLPRRSQIKYPKMTRKVLLIVFCTLAVLSCKKKDLVMEFAVTLGAYDITENSAVLEGKGDAVVSMWHDIKSGVILAADRVPTWEDRDHEFTCNDTGYPCKFTVKAYGLKSGVTYYYRAFTSHDEGHFLGEVKSFTTKMIVASVATQNSIPLVGGAALYGQLSFDKINSDIPISLGFLVGKTPDRGSMKKADPFGEIIRNGEDGSFYCRVRDLQEGEKYYCVAMADINGILFYGEAMPFTVKTFEPSSGEFIDMGLSVKWASCNIGADSPDKPGNYYAWGETATKDNYALDTYTYDYSAHSTLPFSDDAAYVNLSGKGRMPTYEEFQELLENCFVEWGGYRGMRGALLVSSKNGSSVFLPGAGFMSEYSLNNYPGEGWYWTSSYSPDSPSIGYLYFHAHSEEFIYLSWDSYPHHGYSVRAVSE